jgi:hypothetical protein
MFMKRDKYLSVLCFLVIAIFSGCGGSSGVGSDSSPDDGGTDGKKVKKHPCLWCFFDTIPVQIVPYTGMNIIIA